VLVGVLQFIKYESIFYSSKQEESSIAG